MREVGDNDSLFDFEDISFRHDLFFCKLIFFLVLFCYFFRFDSLLRAKFFLLNTSPRFHKLQVLKIRLGLGGLPRFVLFFFFFLSLCFFFGFFFLGLVLLG
jgi:hypothetical protein